MRVTISATLAANTDDTDAIEAILFQEFENIDVEHGDVVFSMFDVSITVTK